MSEDRQLELVEVTRKKQTGNSGRTAASAAKQPGNPGSGQRHRYANVDDPYGLHRRRANGAASDGDFLRATQASSEKEIRLHHETAAGDGRRAEASRPAAARPDRAGASGEAHRSHAHSRGRRYHDYGSVSLGSLPQQDSAAAADSRADPSAGAASEHSSGSDIYARVMSRKYNGKRKQMRRIWIVIAVLLTVFLLAFFLTRRTVKDTLLPKPDVESLPEETFRTGETIQSNQ